MLSRINKMIYKYYVTTWVFVLILFKREIPAWLQGNAKNIVEAEIIIGQAEKYVK